MSTFLAHDRFLLLAAATTGLLLVGACSDSAAPHGTRSLSVSFATASSTPTRSISTSLAAAPADSIILTRAQVVLSHIELATVDSACTVTAQGQEGECEDVQVAAVVVDLPLIAGAKSALTTLVPDGTYSGLEARIGTSGSGGNDGAAATPLLAGKSVRVEGTYGGKPFVYTSDVSAKLELAFAPPLSVQKDGLNVTIGVNAASWFRDASGARLDPSNPANASAIAANIRRSFKAFKDDDKDGNDDNH